MCQNTQARQTRARLVRVPCTVPFQVGDLGQRLTLAAGSDQHLCFEYSKFKRLDRVRVFDPIPVTFDAAENEPMRTRP